MSRDKADEHPRKDEPEESDEEPDDEQSEGKERSSPSSSVVYQAILHEGESELERSSAALAWSGLAAGLSMGFSFLTSALLHAHLPHAKWAPLVTALGYTVGFVIVILGRQQLFTENTLTPVVPLLAKKRAKEVGNVLRLWSIVLVANFAGALLFALVLARTEMVDAETFASLRTVAEEAHRHGPSITFLRAIFAGWLVALLVWLLPFAESARVGVIILMTWLIGAAHFPHVIVGAVDGLFLVFTGARSFGHFFLLSFLPSLAGNILGGVALVAAINHAQVVAGEDGVDA
jgi:formate/nitrite transporter FocA (FNT family)